MSFLAVLLLILLILGAFGGGWGFYNRTPGTPWAQNPYSGWYYGGSAIWLILVIVLLIVLFGP